METQLLREQEIIPNDENLLGVIPELFPLYRNFTSLINNDMHCLKAEWNYYKDGKSWLCKVTFKKKTVFWLSLWNNYLKVGFYFTEATIKGIDQLEIAKEIKESIKDVKMVDKLAPLILNISKDEQLDDLSRIIEYKKSVMK
ncbi:MAG: hypothetical protein A2465_04990 [Bacteroidetes bacterium RIFOXYC2_FULL_39_11]|nr:MAG: hypothetical protein A2465_04990 [Bacteroidetes bacterium RIFOXYC2_FULL_39_11]